MKLHKTYLALFALVAILATSTNANAEQEPLYKNYAYTRFGFGPTKYKKFKKVEDVYVRKAPKMPIYYAGLGRRVHDKIRAELSIQYGQLLYAATNNDDLNLRQKFYTYGLVANFYYDILKLKLFTPYITAGLGGSINKAQDLKIEGRPSIKGQNVKNLIWNAGLGLAYNLDTRMSFDLGYRFMGLGQIKTSEFSMVNLRPASKQKVYGHQFLLSISYGF